MKRIVDLLNNRKGLRYGIIFISGLLFGIVSFFSFNYINNFSNNTDIQVRDYSNSYSFINPLLECDSNGSLSTELKSFKSQLVDEIENIKKDNQVDFVSVYFRDMNNGPWFGINEKEDFSPASLLKVPVMMSYFKTAESDPGLLNKVIKFEKSADSNDEYFKDSIIKKGESYTIEKLIEAMIIHSDNEALNLLIMNSVSYKVDLNDVFQYLGVDLSSDGTTISVKQYSTFFRILFNASYLTQPDSEKALNILNKVNFTSGLKAGLPGDVKVAHKFGERWDSVNPEKQLHDCGIVYYPNHPYLLCVMTKGTDFDKLAFSIADISNFVYKAVDKQFR